MQRKPQAIAAFILATAVFTNFFLTTSSLAAVNYRLIELPTLGGAQDFANSINDAGWVAGAADLPGGDNEHAFLWREGRMLDLGTLGGTNSDAGPVNDRGEVAGGSVTSARDPFKENFCHYNIDGVFVFTDRTCLGFVWLHGVMTPLPTLGGNNDGEFGLNNRGQVVGEAETAIVDPHCEPPQVLDWKPVVWPPSGGVQELPLPAGDSVGAGVAINDLGQVVGGSGDCAPVSTAPSAHALLWRDGYVINLGSFGGKMNNVAFDMKIEVRLLVFPTFPVTRHPTRSSGRLAS